MRFGFPLSLSILCGALLLFSCRSDLGPGEEIARYSAIDADGSVIGESVLFESRVRPGRIEERTVLRDEEGRAVLSLTASIEEEPSLLFLARTRFMRVVDEVEVRQGSGSPRWRKRKGLAVSRAETDSHDPILLSWAVGPDDPPSGSVALWRALARRISEEEPTEQAATAFNIRRGRDFELFVSRREEKELLIDGRDERATRYFVSTRASGHTLWVGTEGRDLLAVDGVMGARMVREDVELPALEPEPLPSALDAVELTVTREDVELSGTLTFPRNRSAPVPAIILVHGSGAMDRDESPFGVFRHLAHDLGEAGFAVLRYDKRGVGESRFLGEERDVKLAAFAGDAHAWLDVLEQREEIDSSRIFIAGHSEGGYIAPMVATMDTRVRGVVMLAGPVDPLLDILVQQAVLIGDAHGMSEDELEETLALQAATLRKVRSTMEPDGPDAEAIEWLRSHDRHDPRTVLRDLEAPVLAIFAAGDVQVPPEQADELAAIAADKPPGAIRVEVIDGIDHLLMDDHGGRTGMGIYFDPDRRVDPRVSEMIADFVLRP